MRPTWGAGAGALLSLAAIIGAQGGSAGAQGTAPNPNGATTSPPSGGVVYYEPAPEYGFVAPPAGNPLSNALSSSYGFIRKDFDSGVGYESGATAVGGFIPVEMTNHSGFFIQPQAFITDVGEGGLNLGGGFRYYVDAADRVLGAYAFYDNDDSRYSNRRGQLSLGVETLGPMWDFRSNVYFPLDADEDFVRFDPGTGLNLYEKAMVGGDMEFGFPIFDPSAFGRLRAYFGLYAYASDDERDDDPAGVRVRLEAHLNQHATFNASFMQDDKFGDMVTMYVELRGWNSRLPGMNNRNVSNKAKMYLPVVRQYRIANETYLD